MLTKKQITKQRKKYKNNKYIEMYIYIYIKYTHIYEHENIQLCHGV